MLDALQVQVHVLKQNLALHKTQSGRVGLQEACVRRTQGSHLLETVTDVENSMKLIRPGCVFGL